MNTLLANGWHLGVKVGGKELIFSGVVHINQPQVDIEFDDMVIEFVFVSDANGPARYESRAEGTQKLIVQLINHTNSFSEGMFAPMLVGNHEKRELFITYCTSAISLAENKRRFEFAFYLGDT
jgi:hypothetical protein